MKIGLGDSLEKHDCTIILRAYTYEKIILLIDGNKIVLELVETDTTWNLWHNQYIARYGINMDEDETYWHHTSKDISGII